MTLGQFGTDGSASDEHVESRYVRIPSEDGRDFPGYFVQPRDFKGPALILLHTMFGVNELFRTFCERYAKAGFAVIAPSLFWRFDETVAMDYEAESYEKGHGYIKQYDYGQGASDVRATAKYLRAMPNLTGRIGAVGYCLGGTLAFVAAAEADIQVAVSYYATNMERHFDKIERVKIPLVVHLGRLDHYAPPAVFSHIESTLKARPNIAFYSYPDAGHGFANYMVRKQYNEAATKLADSRTFGELQRVLGASARS